MGDVVMTAIIIVVGVFKNATQLTNAYGSVLLASLVMYLLLLLSSFHVSTILHPLLVDISVDSAMD